MQDLREDLLKIVTNVSIPDNERRKRVTRTHEIIERIIERMKQVDPLFNAIYRQPIYAGSYYERLKLRRANEYDINLQLVLPFELQKHVHVQYKNSPPGFAVYNLLKPLSKQCAQLDVDYQLFRTIFSDDNRHLSRVKLNRWMQSVTDQVLGEFPQIDRVKHGAPATTIHIVMPDGYELSVDLVPAIQLMHIPRSTHLTKSVRKMIKEGVIARKSCLIPKPHFKDADEKQFRIALPELEKHILSIGGHFKPLIRIFKEIRDRNGLEHAFPSYFIKTFFMNQLRKRSKSFWELDIEKCFMKLLGDFIGVLETGKLDNFFHRRFNLLENMDIDVLNDMKNKFVKIRNSRRIL